jgi:hypothetical protein
VACGSAPRARPAGSRVRPMRASVATRRRCYAPVRLESSLQKTRVRPVAGDARYPGYRVMPYQCRLVEAPNETRTLGDMRPGDMYFAPWQIDDPHYADALSKRYFSEHAANRAPLVVILPDGTPFCVDTRAFGRINPNAEGAEQFGYYGDGWAVTGEPPRITVSPSVNIVGSYHGFIRDGEITDDIDGRAEAHRQNWARRDYLAGEPK